MDNSDGLSWWRRASDGTEVDALGVPLDAFGSSAPIEFFEILGRIVAVNGQIEYLQDRLDHLPPSETTGVRKVDQFLERCAVGRADRNAVVHSRWVFGAHATNPEVILGLRYKTRKRTSGDIATVSVREIAGSEREQDTVQHTLDSLKKLLRKGLATMHIGELAYTEIMLKWTAEQLRTTCLDLPLS
jgi:hypothetical protein